jgi:magnesium chelatase subunit I
MRVMELERTRLDTGEYRIEVPGYIREIVAEVTRLARRSPDISQRSGVSVRASVADLETVLANALRRSIRTGEQEVVPRISDLPFMLASLQGKLEFETFEEGREDRIMQGFINQAIGEALSRRVSLERLEQVVESFREGVSVEAGEGLPSEVYRIALGRIEGLAEAVRELAPNGSPGEQAAAVELVLEGLHLNKLLNKMIVDGTTTYGS